MKPFKTIDIRIVIHDPMDESLYMAKIGAAIVEVIRVGQLDKQLREKDHIRVRATVYDESNAN